MGEDDDLLFVALSLRDTPSLREDEQVDRLLTAAGGKTATLRNAYERAWALAHSSPGDSRARELVDLVTRALHLAVERELEEAAGLAEMPPLVRPGTVSRRSREVEPERAARPLSDRLAKAAGERDRVIDVDRMAEDLERLRSSSSDGRRRR